MFQPATGSRPPRGQPSRMFASFGSTLTSLTASRFFEWFSLEPDGMTADVRSFRPSGPAFHDAVSLEAVTGSGQDLRELHLRLARSFIDDRRNGAFALDITKSFLEDALGRTPLIAELERRIVDQADIAARHCTDSFALSRDEEAVLQTYAGRKAQCELRVDARTLAFENHSPPQTLVITVR